MEWKSPGSKRYSAPTTVMWLVVAFSVVSLTSGINRTSMRYSEIQKIGKSCPDMDSCSHKRSIGSRELDTVGERNCACDYMCEEYRDCCIDAPDYNIFRVSGSDNAWKCRKLRQFGGVYMKGACDVGSSDRELIDLCENKNSNMSDPLGSMPATDSSTGLTYKNYYCGLCNGNHSNLVLWVPRLECPTLTLYNMSRRNLTRDYVFQNLVFDGTNWGLYLDGDNGSLFFHDCEIDPVMPHLLEGMIRLCKTQSVSECAEDWSDDSVREKCKAYTGIRYLHSESYRNVHCAMCNRVNVSLLTCKAVDYREMLDFRTFQPHSFSLLLDIDERKGQNVGLVNRCEDDEIFDPFFKKCRSLSCLPGSVRKAGTCVRGNHQESTTSNPAESTSNRLQAIISSQNDTNILEMVPNERNASYVVVPGSTDSISNHSITEEIPDDTFTNVTDIPLNTSLDSYLEHKIGKFKNCLLITLNGEDYVMFDNKTIYVQEYDKFYEPSSYFASEGSVLVCSHFDKPEELKFTPIMGYVTITGLGISMLCLFLHFVVFCSVPDLQNLSGKNLMSQCVALFFAYSFYIAGLNQLNTISCVVTAFLTFFFFQASFFWMNAMAFDVWRTLKMATTELRITAGRQSKRFFLYSIYSWFIPTAVVGLAAVAEYTDFFPEEYRPRFAQPQCWFKHRRALLSFFAIPLFAVVVSNVVLFASSAKMIIMTTKTTAKQQSSSQKRNFTLYLRLFILMGLTWAIGLVAAYVDIELLWYLFVVLNTLQGLFIFVAFSCSSKVLGHLRDRVSKCTKKTEYKSSSASHSTSSILLRRSAS